MDLLGKVVAGQPIVENLQCILDMSAAPKRIYFIEITGAEYKIVRKKIVLQ